MSASMYSIGAERYRLGFGGPADAVAPTQSSGLSALPTPSAAAGDEVKPWHPSSPLFAFGALAALTFGLMAVSTSGGVSLRVGKTVASVAGGAGVGSTK
jgi:hypothetical protein